MHNVVTKHIEDNVYRPTELFTDLFVSLTGKNATDIDAGGAITQTIDMFANKMCHGFFYLSPIVFFVIQMVVSTCWAYDQ